MDNKYAEQKPAMELVRSFFNPDQLHEPGMMDELLRGVAATSMETLDQFITSHVTNQLFEEEGQPFSGLDLAALNLQRGRDHGLPGYNLYRDARRDAYSVARFGLLKRSRNLHPFFCLQGHLQLDEGRRLRRPAEGDLAAGDRAAAADL